MDGFTFFILQALMATKEPCPAGGYAPSTPLTATTLSASERFAHV